MQGFFAALRMTDSDGRLLGRLAQTLAVCDDCIDSAYGAHLLQDTVLPALGLENAPRVLFQGRGPDGG